MIMNMSRQSKRSSQEPGRGTPLLLVAVVLCSFLVVAEGVKCDNKKNCKASECCIECKCENGSPVSSEWFEGANKNKCSGNKELQTGSPEMCRNCNIGYRLSELFNDDQNRFNFPNCIACGTKNDVQLCQPQNNFVGTSCSACHVCPAGQKVNAAGDGCEKCPDGKYQEAADFSGTSCVSCSLRHFFVLFRSL